MQRDGATEVAPPRSVVDVLRQVDLRPYTMVIVLVIVAIGFQILTNGLFLTPRNLANLARQGSLTAILAAGMVAVIVAGHIDLSAGSAVGLVAVVAAWLQTDAGWSGMPALAVAVVVGVLLGVWQGAWVAIGRVPSFVVTLGGMLIFRGVALVITEGRTLSPLDPAFDVIGQGYLAPEIAVALLVAVYVTVLTAIAYGRKASIREGLPVASRRMLAAGLVGLLAVLVTFGVVTSVYLGVPYPVFIMAGVAAGLALMMRRSAFGRHLYAMGGNPEAAALSGISLRANTLAVFVIMGALYGLVGSLLAARLDAGAPNGGTFMELDAIAAAVIGGTSLLGGIGSVEGAIVGALLMASISNGMSLMNVLTWWQQIVTGLLLMGAVFLDVNSRHRSQ